MSNGLRGLIQNVRVFVRRLFNRLPFTSQKRNLMYMAGWSAIALSIPFTLFALSSNPYGLNSARVELPAEEAVSGELERKTSIDVNEKSQETHTEIVKEEPPEPVEDKQPANNPVRNGNSVDITINGQKIELPEEVKQSVRESTQSETAQGTDIDVSIDADSNGSISSSEDTKIRIKSNSDSQSSNESKVEVHVED